MATVRLRLLTVAGGLLAGVSAALAAGPDRPLPTAELLLDLARDYGLNCRGAQTVADVEHVRVLLRAATRLDPNLAAAHELLYELATLRGDLQQTRDELRQLVAADPENVVAQARRLELEIADLPTVEKRRAWLEAQLGPNSGRRAVQAIVHVQLARLSALELDRASARRHIDQALELDPCNPEAAATRMELLEPDAAPEVRLRAALAFLALSPFSVDTAWQIGVLLDQYGLLDEAGTFFNHAVEIHTLADPNGQIPGAYLLQMAYHLAARGDLEAAARRASDAPGVDPALSAEAGMFSYWLRTKQGRQADADALRIQLAQRFAILREPSLWPVNEIAQAAWFYCTIDPQPQRALMLAQTAAARAPGDPFVTRVLGWAQAANLQTQPAQQTLLPIAGRDPYAAYQLAKILKDAGDPDSARRVIQSLDPPPMPGPALDLLSQLALDAPTSQPASERYPRLIDALHELDSDLLSFHRDPGRFLQVELAPADRSPAPGQPWLLDFSLKNRGRFPITLGPDLMVNPVFLLSFELEGDRKRDYPNLLTVSLTRTRIVLPGQTVRLQQNVDLGPVRRASRLTPQQMLRVTTRAIFDPAFGAAGRWRPGLAGQEPSATYLNRLPADANREGLQSTLGELKSDSDQTRFRAIELVAELLGEEQRARLGDLSYKPQAVPAARLHQALVAGLTSESWELRARTLDALQVAGLDKQILTGVTDNLQHSHWLVRLMAVRLLGARRPDADPARRQITEQLEKVARKDTDELVRALASSYLAAWAAGPTSQPASAPTSLPSPLLPQPTSRPAVR